MSEMKPNCPAALGRPSRSAWLLGARLALGVTLAVGIAFAAGCAQNKGDVNRVQPDYTKKTWITGEWYYRATAAETPALQATPTSMNPNVVWNFPGNQSMLERGVFEIQQNELHFYRTYEWATGSEQIGQAADTDTPLIGPDGQVVTRAVMVNGEEVDTPVYIYRGAPLISWPIMSHFDIMRTYNPTTGEQTNVIQENTEDRKWYERTYMRVDWAAPTAYHAIDFPLGRGVTSHTDGAALTTLGTAPKSGGGPAERMVTEFDESGDEERIGYFDVSARMITQAPTFELEGFGEIPMCWFFPWAVGGIFECQAQEQIIRFAFKRYEPSDFHVWDYDDDKVGRFGYYRADRLTWDTDFGLTHAGVSRPAIRFRIWEQYVRAADGSLDYSQMTPKPIVYYQNQRTPRDLVVPNISLVAEWSEVFEETVSTLKGAPAEHAMIVLCENNLQEACQAYAQGMPTATFAMPGQEAAACAKVGIAVVSSSSWSTRAERTAAFCDVTTEPKRIGDLRYSLLAAIPDQIQAGLYGYGPPSFDPLTGEIISANSYSYAAPMLRGATRALHTLEMMAGVRTFLEIEDRSYIQSYLGLKRLRRGGSVSALASDLSTFGQGGMSPEAWTSLSTTGLPTGNTSTQARLAKIAARPDLDEMTIAPEFRRYVKDPTMVSSQAGMQDPAMTDFSRNLAAPRNWSTHATMEAEERHEAAHSHHCQFTERFADSALLGLAREYEQRYNLEFCTALDGQFPEVFDWDAFRSVGAPCKQEGATNGDGLVCRRLTAEVGGGAQLRWTNPCTVRKLVEQMRSAVERIEGLDPFQMYEPGSPAFESSKREELAAAVKAFRGKLDEMRDICVVELWQMIYRGTQAHEVGHNLGLRHNFEASTDTLNFHEDYWRLKLEPDEAGGYRAVNLWQPDTTSQSYLRMREFETSSVMEYTRKFNGRDRGLGHYDRAAIYYGYGGLVEVFDQAPDLASLEPFTKEPAGAISGNQSVLGPARTPLETALRKVHHTRYPHYFGSDIANMYRRTLKPEHQVGESEVMVPYRYCSDEYAGMTPTCQRHDEGADPYEIAQRHAENYESYWPFEGYSHDSVTWSATHYAGGVGRYFYELRKQFQYWVQLKLYYDKDDWWANNIGNGKSWDDDINGGLTYKEAAKLSFNVLANAFGRPAEARYGLNSCNGRFEPRFDLSLCQYTKQTWITQEDGARPFYEAFDFEGYLYTPWRSGAIYDRIFAFAALTDPIAPDFLNVEVDADRVRYMVNYHNAWPKEMTRLMGGLMTSDEQTFGWWVCGPNQTPQEVRARNYFAQGAPEGCWTALNPEPTSVFANAKYRMPALAALHGMALMTRNFDRSFIDASRICLEGSGDCVEIAPGTDVARFADPLSGKVYMAARYSGGADYDPAYELVSRAANAFSAFTDAEGNIQLELLQDEYYFSELQFLTGRLELIRGMRTVYGSGL